MTKDPNPNQPPLFPSPPAGSTPQQVAQRIADSIRSSILVLFWVVVGAACIAVAVVSLATIYWLVRLALNAIGVS